MNTWIDASAAPVFGRCPAGADVRFREAAYAVIPDPAGRVAAVSANVRGRDDLWLPGGGREPGETAVETIEREVREELGCGVCVLRRLGEAVQFFFAGDRGCWCEMHACFYLAVLGEPIDASVRSAWQWIDPLVREQAFFHGCHAWACRRARRLIAAEPRARCGVSSGS